MRHDSMISATDTGAAALLYREGKADACAYCGGTQWLVGRMTAECATCEMALPLTGAPTFTLALQPAVLVRTTHTA